MHHYRCADERNGPTADHRHRRHYHPPPQHQHQQQQYYNNYNRNNNNNNNQQQQRVDHYGGGRWSGGGDERWPAEARPPRRPYKKFANFRKFDDDVQETRSPPPPRSYPSSSSSSSRCYRGETSGGGKSVEWEAMCKHFARLNQNENVEKFKNRYSSSSIPQNHHLQYYSDLHKLHNVAYAARNTTTNFVKKQRPQPLTCDPWHYTPCNRSLYAYSNKYCLSAPEMYASHAKDVAWDDLQITVDEEDQLSSDVWRKYLDSRQPESVYKTKMDMWQKLSTTIKSLAPNCGLYMVGSTMNGFGGDVSDADFCLLIGCTALLADERHRTCGVDRLRWMADLLENDASIGATDVSIVYAKVPILRFRWTVAGNDDNKIDVDLCCNHMVGIRNTHLLYCYSRLDYRVRPLVLTIKLWASRHNINDPKKMTLSSYSLVLMVINFLQCVKPAVVPSLQHIYGMKFSTHTDIEFVHMHEKLPRNSWRSENKQSLGELLLQFFEYYNNFNYFEKAVSVRTGGLLSLEYCRLAETEKNDPGQWKFIGIEEPFERTNTARSVHNHNVFNQIREAISKSNDQLKKTKSLDSIFCRFEQ